MFAIMFKWISPHTVELTIDGHVYRVDGESVDNVERGRYWRVFPKMVYSCSGSTAELLTDDQLRYAVLENLYSELRKRGIAFEE